MSRAPLRFKENDLVRAMRATQKAGGGWGVEILADGTIRILPTATFESGKACHTPHEEAHTANPWDGEI